MPSAMPPPSEPTSLEQAKGAVAPTSAKDPVDALNDTIADDLKTRLAANVRQKKDLHQEWKRNVELRLGRPNGMQALLTDLGDDNESLQSAINPDWYLTKTKIANLYSQVPEVQGTHIIDQYGPAVAPFTKQLNYELSEKRSNVGVAMREVLADIVNAAGIGFVLIDYVARFEDHEVPSMDVSQIDPRLVEEAIKRKLIPTTTVSQVVSDKFPVTRIAPMDGIWPADFAGSNFDDADFMGYRGRMSDADAIHALDLTEEQVAKALDGGTPGKEDSLKVDSDSKANTVDSKKLTFDRLFYWRHRVDPDETSLTAIWEIVYVKGITKPVKHEPWRGQRQDPQTGKYVGACKFPVRAGTITYVSDNPIVPSDSAAGRPQVADLRRSRSQMFLNRKRSTPLRWYNVNQVGPEIQAQLNDGTFQGMIPTNGTGERAVGEIARASYPSEDLSFDQKAEADLLQSWGLTPSSMGLSTPGRKNQLEVGAEVSGFSTNIGSDRALIQQFFLGIVEVLAGLMALYSEFPVLSPQEKQAMEAAWNRQQILIDLVLKIRPDSMIVLDPQQRAQRLTTFLNMTVKSGYVAPKSVIVELAELNGLDPAVVVIDPVPPQPKEPQLSYRFTGKDDMQNLGVVALLAKNHALPGPQDVQAAKDFLLASSNVAPISPSPAGAPGLPADPAGGAAPGAGAPPPSLGAAPVPPAPGDAEAHPSWVLGSRVAKRSRDVGGG